MKYFDEYQTTKPAILIKAALDLIHEPGEVFEVRVPKTRAGTISGYFNDTATAAALIARENGKHQSMYVTVNPVNPDLLARSENKLEYGTFLTSSDGDIVRRRWFLMDFDPVRPAGISSSDAELQESTEKADVVIDWLTSIGWPQPIRANSGNGVHVMYKVDEPNDDAARIDFECALKMLSSIFSDDKVKVDVTVFNASRVWKIYGTVSAKGSDTDERPHRVAMITSVPSELKLVTREQIENVARPIRDAKSEEYRDMTGEFITDMVKWLEDRKQTVVSGPRPMFGNEGQKWIISKCPFNDTHQNPMVGLVNNRPVYRCLHDSCSAFRWKEFREKVDPTYKDPETVYDRLKGWCDGDQADMDTELVQTACATGKQLSGIIKRLKKECSRPRVLLLEDLVKAERQRFQKATIGENNERGNIVGLINRTRDMQTEGIIPMFWIADYDHRIRVGKIGDVDCPKVSEGNEIELLVKFHSMGDSWVKQSHTAQVIKYLADEHRVNPLRVHFKQLRWDGVKRLDNWLVHYMGTKDTIYTRAIGRKWMISAVARAMEPGCQADHMLIFEGAQGVGKSQALRALGGQFYCEYSGGMTGTGTAHKDLVAVIAGKMIVEMSELATVRKGDMEALKAILTTTVDDARLSYERDAKSYPRTCVFAGTTNEVGQAYIADLTGARRFWPCHVGESGPVRVVLLKQDRDQLWAEAMEAYESGEDWYTVPVELVAEEQSDRQMSIENTEPWFMKIRAALTDGDSFANELFYTVPRYEYGQETEDFNVRLGAIHMVLGQILQIDTARQSQQDVIRLQKILRGIGFKKTRPSRKWLGSSYAFDLQREAIPHLWSSIDAARKSVKFPKPVESGVDADRDI
ncbi:Virulence-associated E [uncultured Caudovirales phage]|uniref:Virulence-associated E n=1 Tax=uncultured Caudovirales phage TaxID=2100421 RepID=A0A6J5PB17_9CAUD|nr:Virulence-associated E [uncultured Caudovirales phage]